MNRTTFLALQSGSFTTLREDSLSFSYASSSTETKQAKTRKGAFYFNATLKFFPEEGDSISYDLSFKFTGKSEDYFVSRAFVRNNPEDLETGNALTAYLLRRSHDKNKIYDEDMFNPLIMQQIRRKIVKFINNNQELWKHTGGNAVQRTTTGDVSMSIDSIG